jgi:hypothetical protein
MAELTDDFVDGTNDHFNSIKAQLLHFDMELKSL